MEGVFARGSKIDDFWGVRDPPKTGGSAMMCNGCTANALLPIHSVRSTLRRIDRSRRVTRGHSGDDDRTEKDGRG